MAAIMPHHQQEATRLLTNINQMLDVVTDGTFSDELSNSVRLQLADIVPTADALAHAALPVEGDD